MTDDAQYRIYRSADTVLIRAGAREIELTAKDALRLGQDLRVADEAPAVFCTAKGYVQWTDALRELVRHKYVDEGWQPAVIAKHLGINSVRICSQINLMKLPPQNPLKGVAGRLAAAAKRATSA